MLAWAPCSPERHACPVRTNSHRAHVEELLSEAEAAHRDLLAAVAPDVAASLPVDAQGITRAIDHLADAAGLSVDQRRRLIQPHSVNPAVLHARVFGATPLTDGTVLGAFVDGARVRADALVTLTQELGNPGLEDSVRRLLIDHPLPLAQARDDDEEPIEDLRDAYAAQERAALLIASWLDAL
jgi:hypothetical protein